MRSDSMLRPGWLRGQPSFLTDGGRSERRRERASREDESTGREHHVDARCPIGHGAAQIKGRHRGPEDSE